MWKAKKDAIYVEILWKRANILALKQTLQENRKY